MYTLIWSKQAEADLAMVWIDASTRPAVTRAAAQAEAILRAYPYGQAVHLSEGLWRLVVPPLAVFFAIDQPARTVTISQVNTVS